MNSSIVVTGQIEALVEAFFPSKFDKHVQDWKWHLHISNINPNYLADIAARQAAKRAAGIGPKGLCHA